MEKRVVFKPSRKQYEAWLYLHDKDTQFVGYGGSAFSGKSYLMCWWLITNALQYPDTTYGLCRKELTMLKKTTLITLFKVIKEFGLTIEDFNYNKSLNIITFNNGSKILLLDTAYKPADPLYERFGGLELTSCAIDESGESNFKAIEILSTRIGRCNNYIYGISPKILETFNPSKNHIYSRYYKPWKDGEEREGYRFIKALPSDNPSPEVEGYIKRIISSSTKTTIARLIHGDFEYDDNPDVLIEYDNIINLWTNNHVKRDENNRYMVIDVARLGKDKSVIMIWYGYNLTEIITINKNTINELGDKINELKVKHKIPNSNIIADESGVGGGLVDYMNIKGFVGGSRALNDENYQNLRTQCFYKLSSVINENRIYIETDKFKEDIIQELEQIKSYKVDSDGKLRVLPKDMVKDLIGRSPDYSDTMSMRMWFELTPDEGKYFIY